MSAPRNRKGGREISDTFDLEKWARATLKALGHKPDAAPFPSESPSSKGAEE